MQLHRPGGEQHRLFLASLPATRLPAARVQGAPAARPARGDGPARDQPRRLGDRPLHRPHADRLALAGPVRPRRGLPAQPPADLPARRQPRLGQDDLPRAGRLAGLPAGLGADRRHRPQGRPPPRAPARRRRADRDDRALRRGALPRPARPDADRRRGDPRGPHLQLPRLDPAGAGQARVADPAAPGDLRGRRRAAPAAAPRSSPALPALGQRRGGRGRPRDRGPRPGRPRQARPRQRPSTSCPRSATPRSSRCGSATSPCRWPAPRALGAARGGAHQPRRPAPARRLRAAPLRLRHRRATRCWRWTRPGR